LVPSPARRPGNGSPGVLAPTTHASKEDPDHPGVPRPGTFRPQGLITLAAAYAPPSLATVRRPPQRQWDSPSRVLLPPTGRPPLEDHASPVVFSNPRTRGRPRLQSSAGREGVRLATVRRRGRPKLALLGFGPSKAFSSTTFEPASRSEPLIPFRPEVLPTFLLPGGVPGVCVRRKRLVSLKTAGLPGVSRLFDHEHRLGQRPLRAYGFASASVSMPPRASLEPRLPDRSLVFSRVGATNRTRHPTPIFCFQ
jgi:hypothetical protein